MPLQKLVKLLNNRTMSALYAKMHALQLSYDNYTANINWPNNDKFRLLDFTGHWGSRS